MTHNKLYYDFILPKGEKGGGRKKAYDYHTSFFNLYFKKLFDVRYCFVLYKL